MPLSLTCPECAGKLKAPDTAAGKQIKCPKCAAIFAAAAPAEVEIVEETPPAQPEGVTSNVAPDIEELDEIPLPPRRSARNIRRDPTEEAVSTIIPYKNVKALIAYYLGVFSLIPCAGLLLGPAAFILGIMGMRYVKANPSTHGTGHAIAGIILGGLTSLANWGGVVVAVCMAIWG